MSSPWTEVTNETLRRIFTSDKIRSIFYTDKFLFKLLCKPKDSVATGDKNNIVYEIDCSNCETVSFDGFRVKIAFRWTQKIFKDCDWENNEIAKHCFHNFSWDQKKVVDKGSRLISKKSKETINSLKNPSYINKFSFMSP